MQLVIVLISLLYLEVKVLWPGDAECVAGSRQLFSLLSVSSFSPLDLHKLTLLVYNSKYDPLLLKPSTCLLQRLQASPPACVNIATWWCECAIAAVKSLDQLILVIKQILNKPFLFVLLCFSFQCKEFRQRSVQEAVLLLRHQRHKRPEWWGSVNLPDPNLQLFFSSEHFHPKISPPSFWMWWETQPVTSRSCLGLPPSCQVWAEPRRLRRCRPLPLELRLKPDSAVQIKTRFSSSD